MITIGTHNCIVLPPIEGWFAESGKSNTPYLRIMLRVTDGECPGEEIEWAGWLTERAATRTIETLQKVFGWDGDMEALAQCVDEGPFVGKKCRIVTEEEEYEGKKRVKIKWLNAATPPGLSRTRAMEIARKFTGGTAAPAAPAPQASGLRRLNTPPRPAADPDLDVHADDVPF